MPNYPDKYTRLALDDIILPAEYGPIALNLSV